MIGSRDTIEAPFTHNPQRALLALGMAGGEDAKPLVTGLARASNGIAPHVRTRFFVASGLDQYPVVTVVLNYRT